MTHDNTAGIKDINLPQAARIAGLGLLFMFIFGLLGSGPKVEVGDIIDAHWVLRKNMFGDIMMLVCDTVAAFGLYVFLKPVNRSLSLLAAWFRLLHVALYGAMVLILIFVLYLLDSPESLSAFSPEQLHAQAALFLHGHSLGFMIGLVFFGIHFLVLGYLISNSSYVPKPLGVFLIIIGVGYLINSFSSFLIPAYGDFQTTIQMIVFIPAIFVEFSLCLWLLFKGSKITEV